MGKVQKGKAAPQLPAASAVELFPGGVPSEPYALGRRLRLEFDGGNRPELDRIEFQPKDKQKGGFLQRGFDQDTDLSFRWTEMPKALSLFFLEYLVAGFERRPFAFRRTPQTETLADAVVKTNGKLFRLFLEHLPTGGTADRVDRVFDGVNLNRTDDRERSVFVNTDYLPHDCVEIVFESRPLTRREDVINLAAQFRKVWKMPPPCELEFKIGEASFPPQETSSPAGATNPPPASQQPRQQELLPDATVRQPPKAEPAVEPSTHPEVFKFSKWFAHELGQAFDILRRKPPDAPGAKHPQASPTPTPEPKAKKPGPANATSKADPPAAEVPPPELTPLPPIDPRYFMLPETGPLWPDQAPLVELPGEEDTYQWTLKNAFEGVLIMGRTGSGKTSGSGFTFAESFIRGGFGGLVLTVKKNEAENWRRLCAHCGREKDLLVVSRGGEWKLNALAYESQHPGRGAGLAENLTSFCRNLLRISSRSQGPQDNDQFWTNAGDQLLNSMFDLFLLAGGGITFDRLANFVSAAPTANIPANEEAWMKVPVFGTVFKRAKEAIASPEDERVFSKARDYWCKIYPGLSSKTRTSITLGIYAMLDAFRGRDIPALISGETTISPEAVMCGFIVVLDLPLKELGHTGLMVQSAWKYLFQTALERHESSRGPNRRPVFLWEDEAQYFFSEHDHHFQDTARSSRVCRVVLTQNLHSFYKELGRDGVETASSVFGNLNTKIFHNNSDPQTNEWAAKHFGTEIHSRFTISHAPPPPARDFLDSFRQSIDPPNTTSVSAVEHWEYAVRPEEFNRLRTGGPENDFMVDAYITWMGLSAENQRHFTQITFAQNPNL